MGNGISRFTSVLLLAVSSMSLGFAYGRGGRVAEPLHLAVAAPSTTPSRDSGPLLTKHDDETFTNQTIYLNGQAFIRCKFVACTMVLRDGLYHLDGSNFERCNWHVDRMVLWGDPESTRELRSLIDMIDAARDAAAREKK